MPEELDPAVAEVLVDAAMGFLPLTHRYLESDHDGTHDSYRLRKGDCPVALG